MSIIYDALKKAQVLDSKGTDNLPVLPPKTKKSNTLKYTVYFLAVSLGFISTFMLFKFIPHLVSSTKKPLTTPALTYTPPVEEIMPELPAVTEPANPALLLNGLLLSQDDRYAIINNQIVKEGDTIEGAVVKRITSSGVDLDFAGRVLQLSNAN